MEASKKFRLIEYFVTIFNIAVSAALIIMLIWRF